MNGLLKQFRVGFFGPIVLWACMASFALGQEALYTGSLPPYPAPIFVRTEMGGKDLKMMVLNACGDKIVLNTSNRNLLATQLPNETEVSTGGVLSSIEMFRVKSETKIGSGALDIEAAGVEDLSRLYNYSGYTVDGLLGMVDTVKDWRFELLYGQEKLRICHGPAKDLSGYDRAPLTFVMGLPVVELDIDGVLETFFIDTSGNTVLSFNKKTFERLVKAGRIEEGSAPNVMSSAERRALVRSGKIKNLQIFGRQLRGVNVSCNENEQSKLGTGLLVGFDSIIDFPGHVIWYRPIEIKHPLLDVELMLGARFGFFKNSLAVLSLQDGGPAGKAGIARFDLIKRIADLSGDKFNLISLQELCRKHENAEVEVEFYHYAADANVKARLQLPNAIISMAALPALSRE